jgi:hypothetical protein
MIRLATSQASPEASDPTMNSTRPKSQRRLAPKRSTAQVVIGMVAVRARRYPVDAQPMVLTEASKALVRVSTATAIMVPSRIPMMPPSSTTLTSLFSAGSHLSSDWVTVLSRSTV